MIASIAAYKPGPRRNRPHSITKTWKMLFRLRHAPPNKLALCICQYATAKKMKPKKESKAAPSRLRKS